MFSTIAVLLALAFIGVAVIQISRVANGNAGFEDVFSEVALGLAGFFYLLIKVGVFS